MKKIFLFICVFSYYLPAFTQHKKEKNLILAISNTNSALAFNKLGGLVTETYHPGIEIGTGLNWAIRQKHDWFQHFKIGYFYHRLVQHGIPIYTETGYRYKFNHALIAETALGLGYMHSIPAGKIFKLNADGAYKSSKGIGRPQAIATISVGMGYILKPDSPKPVKVFMTLQQRLQFPFVKSYVPVLPYNSLIVGASIPLKKLFYRKAS